MHKFRFALFLAFFLLQANAQIPLPLCQIGVLKHQCIGQGKSGEGTYTGEYLDGKPNGLGEWVHPNGDKYKGEFLNDSFNGQGTYISVNGETYRGGWVNDVKHGRAEISQGNGDKYIVEVVKGQIIFGTYYFSDESVYVGQFKNNKFHGLGAYTSIEGDLYVGEFKEDSFEGRGSFYMKNGDKYIGDWVKGRKEGLGTYYKSSGEIYVGHFRNGQANGEGITYMNHGVAFISGLWEDGKLVKPYFVDIVKYSKPKIEPSEK